MIDKNACNEIYYNPANNIWLQQRFHNVGEKVPKRWHIKLLQHIPGKFQECCHNAAAKRCKKISPEYDVSIHSQCYDTIFTMLLQPFCNMGQSAYIISGHALEQN